VIKGSEGGLLVIDYKTSKREKSKIELFEDTQMKGYVYAVHKKFGVPLADITAAHYYPVTDNFVSVKYSQPQINSYKGKIMEEVWRIRKAKKLELCPSKNDFCNWCAYKELCPEFNDSRLVESKLQKIKNDKKSS
jgi:CRISPR/Cas system-associated exonuclease Cas4 (RecB family)